MHSLGGPMILHVDISFLVSLKLAGVTYWNYPTHILFYRVLEILIP